MTFKQKIVSVLLSLVMVFGLTGMFWYFVLRKQRPKETDLSKVPDLPVGWRALPTVQIIGAELQTNWYTDDDIIFDALIGLNTQQYKAILNEYHNQFPDRSLIKDISENMQGEQRTVVLSYFKNL